MPFPRKGRTYTPPLAVSCALLGAFSPIGENWGVNAPKTLKPKEQHRKTKNHTDDQRQAVSNNGLPFFSLAVGAFQT